MIVLHISTKNNNKNDNPNPNDLDLPIPHWMGAFSSLLSFEFGAVFLFCPGTKNDSK
jgi:hypothetical protein